MQEVGAHDERRLQDIADLLADAKKIVVFTGAGISTSCGIPDFRSKDGLYSLIKDQHDSAVNSSSSTSTPSRNPTTPAPEFELPSSSQASNASASGLRSSGPSIKGQDLFDSSIWKNLASTFTFYKFIASLRQTIRDDVKETSRTHKFIRTLRDGGKLVRCYTQNIDGLEAREGLCTDLNRGKGSATRLTARVSALPRPDVVQPKSEFDGGCEVVQLHGDLESLRCSLCQQLCSWDEEERMEKLLMGEAPQCEFCHKKNEDRTTRGKRGVAVGLLRPNIVLYGEEHPSSHLISPLAPYDLKQTLMEFAKSVHSRKGGKGKVIFVNRTKPAESIWNDFIDSWVGIDCDDWVSDLKLRREELWSRQGELKPNVTKGGGMKSVKAGPSQTECQEQPDAETADNANTDQSTLQPKTSKRRAKPYLKRKAASEFEIEDAETLAPKAKRAMKAEESAAVETDEQPPKSIRKDEASALEEADGPSQERSRKDLASAIPETEAVNKHVMSAGVQMGPPQLEQQQQQQDQPSALVDIPPSNVAPATVNDRRSSRACESCRRLKVRCVSDDSSISARCGRCAKVNRDCIFTAPSRTPQRKRTDTQVGELEKEVQASSTLLNLGGGSIPRDVPTKKRPRESKALPAQETDEPAKKRSRKDDTSTVLQTDESPKKRVRTPTAKATAEADEPPKKRTKRATTSTKAVETETNEPPKKRAKKDIASITKAHDWKLIEKAQRIVLESGWTPNKAVDTAPRAHDGATSSDDETNGGGNWRHRTIEEEHRIALARQKQRQENAERGIPNDFDLPLVPYDDWLEDSSNSRGSEKAPQTPTKPAQTPPSLVNGGAQSAFPTPPPSREESGKEPTGGTPFLWENKRTLPESPTKPKRNRKLSVLRDEDGMVMMNYRPTIDEEGIITRRRMKGTRMVLKEKNEQLSDDASSMTSVSDGALSVLEAELNGE